MPDYTYTKETSLFKNITNVNNDVYDVEEYTESLTVPGLGNMPSLKRTVLVSRSEMLNIKDNFIWKNSGDVSSTEEVPGLVVEEKTLKMTGVAATLTNIYNTIQDRATSGQDFLDALSDPYGKLYVIENNSRAFKYKFPWLLSGGSNLRTISNTWNDLQNNPPPSSSSDKSGSEPGFLSKLLAATAGTVAGTMTPGIEIDPIYNFKSTNNLELTIKFPLYNTFDIDSTTRNFHFVTLITYQNLKNRTSMVTYVPPSVYTITGEAIGGVYMPIAVMKTLSINNLGTTRQIKDDIIPGRVILIPEAYEISLTFQELLPQSTNIFEGAMGANRVNVSDVAPLGTAILSNGGRLQLPNDQAGG